MKEMKAPVAENRADLKNIPCGNECFLRKNLPVKEASSQINSYSIISASFRYFADFVQVSLTYLKHPVNISTTQLNASLCIA